MSASNEATWTRHYGARHSGKRYPTEFVLRTLMGNYPDLQLDKTRYPSASMLDLSCGDGRNLELLQDLGFRVSATEITEELLTPLRERFPDVAFATGKNHALPYADGAFDYILK